MATLSGMIRRGLPRVESGEPWPPAGTAVAGVIDGMPSVEPALVAPAAAAGPNSPISPSAPLAPMAATSAAAAQPTGARGGAVVSEQPRRGLPRVPGGDPWPSASAASPADAAVGLDPARAGAAAPAIASATPVQSAAAAAAPPAAPGEGTQLTAPLRRGLPRIADGEPWPPAGFTAAVAAGAPAAEAVAMQVAVEPVAEVAARVAEVPDAPALFAAPVGPVKPAVEQAPKSKPAPAAALPQKLSSAEKKPTQPKAEARLYGSRTLAHWCKFVALITMGAIAAAALLVLAARGVTTLPGVPEFLEKYPGEYHLPETAEPGFPWWAQWTHFMNIFLMVLIIRSGYQVRTQQKPPAYWTPKRGGKKISINLWLHQSLDILWLLNGLIFVVLLFVSGHWMRIVPSSWEVFPNALSALLQYMTLEWPVENGWVNYNSLQQLMYFIVVFIAAPLAALSGVRMSEFWPKNAKALNKIYPVEAARVIHFPTMLFFVLFILIHVFLVFSTGALRNLNHMFAGADVVNWTGFWLFAAAIAVTVGAWFAARPLFLAPLAKLFGQVSSR